MPESTDKNIRIPVPGESGKHTEHKIRTIVISVKKGIKALYCVTCKKIITYIFAKNKDWTMATAKAWVKENTKKTKSLSEINLDQLPEFLKIVAVDENGDVEDYLPNSNSFVLDKEIEEFTTGMENIEERIEKKQVPYEDMNDKARGDGQGQGGGRQGDGGANVCVCPECGKEVSHKKGTPCTKVSCPKCGASMTGKSNKSDGSIDCSIDITKFDKQKQIVYGVFLVPDKADHDGDVIDSEDIEKVSHGFISDYRTIDEMHKNIISADIVESAIAWKDGLDFYGKKLKKGTWFGAIKIHDQEVWNKVLLGEYKAFSVRISGVREKIEEEGQ